MPWPQLGDAEPGQAANPFVLRDMQPGIYILICFIDVPEGIPQVMGGMVLELEVTP